MEERRREPQFPGNITSVKAPSFLTCTGTITPRGPLLPDWSPDKGSPVAPQEHLWTLGISEVHLG